MTDDNHGFCPACGQMLTEDSAYCPSCGKPLGGDPSPSYRGDAPMSAGRYSDAPMGGLFLIAFLLTMFFAVITLILGAYTAFSAESMVGMLEDLAASQGISLADLMASFGTDISGMSHADIVAAIRNSGLAALGVAVLALAGGVLCYMRRRHIVAAALVAVAALASYLLGGFITVIIGLLVAVCVYISKDYFKD